MREQIWVFKGRKVRPFSQSANVSNHAYSLLLQRVITDFGTDFSFCSVPAKIKEHYGIEVSRSAVQSIAEYHAKQAGCFEHTILTTGKNFLRTKASVIITSSDGSMVPIVERKIIAGANTKVDGRKAKGLLWKEARLCMARPEGSVTPVYGGTIGSPLELGLLWEACARRAGLGSDTHVHGLGDGATWVHDGFVNLFGTNGKYTIDFFHLCTYLSDAAETCCPKRPMHWLENEKELFRASKVHEALEALRPHIEPEARADKDAPVRNCFRYIANRMGQFDYKKAIDSGLPIGSGEIESAHRYIIQSRLKKPGTWWREDHAKHMIELRAMRANGDWDLYWSGLRDQLAA